MSRRPWFTRDRQPPKTSTDVGAEVSKLQAMVAQMRSARADAAQSRERLQQQMGMLLQQKAKLERQVGLAMRAGREDLARECLSRTEVLQNQHSELAALEKALNGDEEKLADAEQRLLAKLDVLRRTPGYVPRPPSTPAAPGSDAPVGERTSRVIPQDVRIKVAVRDGGKCRQCGSAEDLHFDHVIPWSKGGANTVNNIQLLCGPCNRRKGDDEIPAHL
jgi:HNH endonuclease